MKAVRKGDPSPVELENRMFYAHLYLGLYDEARGDAKSSFEHLKHAATDYSADHYMEDVARVHFKRLLEKTAK
jgi:lipoprotein NlpI